MARKKIPKSDIEKTVISKTINNISDSISKLNKIVKKIEACFIYDNELGRFVCDPFKAKSVIGTLKEDKLFIQLMNSEHIKELYNDIIEECKKAGANFERELYYFCDKYSIHFQGRFPNYILQDFLKISVSTDTGICQIGKQKIKSLFIPSLSNTINENINQEKNRLFDLKEFVEQLLKAYNRVVTLSNKRHGEPVRLKDVFCEIVFIKQSSKFQKSPIKNNFTDYTEEFFSRDLSQLIKSGINQTKSGKRLELSPTSFPKEEGLPVLISGSIRYVGRLSFF